MTLRLRYACIAVLLALGAGCAPQPMTRDQAISVAKSHMHGDALIQGAQMGPLAELAPPGMSVDDPSRLVWVVTMRGTFAIDCKVNAAGNAICPRVPTLGLIVLDAFDGSSFAITRITIVPPTEAPPTEPPGVVSRAGVSSAAGLPLPA